MSQKKILVPVNFDRVSEVCVNHAYSIAQRIKAELHLLHLVDDVADLDEGRVRLANFTEERQAVEGTDVTIHQNVRVGDILERIGTQAEEMEATLVVMGTHGLQGLEYLVGTHAVRIVGTANVPFIIVQEKKISKNGYENIIVPIELESEAKQKLGLVAQMALAFDSTVHLITPFEKDEHLRNAQQRNLTYAEGFFKKRGISNTSTIASEENDDLDEAAFQLIEEKQGDLIAIMNWHGSRIIGGIGTDDTQDIMLNKDMVPVMIINPKMIGNFELFRTTI